MPIDRGNEVLDVSEAAELLRVSRDVVYELLKSGSLPGRKVGREWRMSRSAILSWLDGNGDGARHMSDSS